MDVPKEAKFQAYEYLLTYDKVPNNGWNCDRIPGAGKCFSGLTGFNQSNGISRW